MAIMSELNEFEEAFGMAAGDAEPTPAPEVEPSVEASAPIEPAEPLVEEPVIADGGEQVVEAVEPQPEAAVEPAPAPVQPAPVINATELAEAMVAAQARAAAPAPAPAPANQEPRMATAEDFLDDKAKSAIALLNSEWGEVATAVQPLITAHVQAALKNQEAQFLTLMQQRLGPVESVVVQSQEQMYWQTIQAAHPDFQEAAAAIPAWIENQPSIVRPALLNAYNKGTAAEVVELIAAYKQANGTTGAAPAQPASSAAQVKPQVAPVAKADLAATLAPPAAQRSSVTTSRDPNDFESSFVEAFGAAS